jgi:hypothetical protein
VILGGARVPFAVIRAREGLRETPAGIRPPRLSDAVSFGRGRGRRLLASIVTIRLPMNRLHSLRQPRVVPGSARVRVVADPGALRARRDVNLAGVRLNGVRFRARLGIAHDAPAVALAARRLRVLRGLAARSDMNSAVNSAVNDVVRPHDVLRGVLVERHLGDAVAGAASVVAQGGVPRAVPLDVRPPPGEALVPARGQRAGAARGARAPRLIAHAQVPEPHPAPLLELPVEQIVAAALALGGRGGGWGVGSAVLRARAGAGEPLGRAEDRRQRVALRWRRHRKCPTPAGARPRVRARG